MPQDLLARAHEQAKRSEAPVRAAALLRVARVQTAFNREQARHTFQQALAETHQLSGQDRDFLFDQARFLAAAVAPDLLPGIPLGDHGLRQFSSEMLGKIMLDHGHADAAYEFLMRYDEPSGFPFGLVQPLMQRIDEEVRRLAMLRRATEAWRAAPDSRTAHRFISLVQFSWQVLPPEEARELAREIVRLTLSQPDHPTSATYDMEQKVRITSGRQHTLFLVLHILRRLDAALAESLIAEHQQLAAAALRFPNGMESVQEEAEHRRRTAVATTGSGGFVMAGSPRDFPYMRALMQGSQDGDLGPAMEHALVKYQEDTAPDRPNLAPREFWPSASRFRSILYKAGKRLGPNAAVYLDRIPDDDLRLFAQIELAAALAGLPEMQDIQREYHRRPDAIGRASDPGPAMPGIRCPQCNWSPRAAERWLCRCGHIWNTFETRGLCPSCRYQWETTECNRCHKSSPHSAWYVQE